jgi:hypothetical protein
VNVLYAAERGDLQDQEAIDVAQRVLARLTPTELAALRSRGDQRHPVPDIPRFKTVGNIYLLSVEGQLAAERQGERERSAQLEAAREAAHRQQQAVEAAQEAAQQQAAEAAQEAAQQQQAAEAAQEAAQQQQAVEAVQAAQREQTRHPQKRGANRSWQQQRIEQSFESSFEDSASISELLIQDQQPQQPAAPQQPLHVPPHQPLYVPPHHRITPHQIPASGTTPPHHKPSIEQAPTPVLPPSPVQAPPRRTPETPIVRLPPTPKVSPPEKTFSQGGYTPPLRPTKIEEAKDCDQSVLPDVETEPIQLPYVHIAVDESLSIEDLPQSASEYKWEGSSAPSVYQKEEPLSSPAYQNNDDTFWNDYPLHNDDENQILHICRLLYDRLDTMEATIQKLVKELEARDKQRDAEREEERKEREAEREEDRKRFNDMMDAMRLHTLESTMTDDERKKAEAKTKLEAMRKQKLAELEAELKAEYEKEGLDFAPQIPYGQGYRWNSEKVEYPKADTIGILNPLPIHKEWTGQAVDANGVWLSFSKWLTHLQAVMDQKESDVWKRACLDVATLTCLRGRAIDWWHSLLPEQQKILRYDTKLEHWDTLGKALHRNEQILRKEARDRVRQVGDVTAHEGLRLGCWIMVVARICARACFFLFAYLSWLLISLAIHVGKVVVRVDVARGTRGIVVMG